MFNAERPSAAERPRALRVPLAPALLAAALLHGPALAQPETGSRLDTAPRGAVPLVERNDQVTARRVVEAFSACLFYDRRRVATQILAAPYSSDRQVEIVRDEVQGVQDCMGRNGVSMALHAPTLAGGLAEAAVHARFGTADLTRLTALTDADVARTGLIPRNGYEDLALCIVRAGPAAVKDFISTEPASTFERVAFRAVVPLVAPCVPRGQNLSLDMAALRSMVAVGLYRALDALAPPAERN
jgi:hypothetical protein